MKKTVFLAAGFSLMFFSATAQKLGDGYVKWPDSQQLDAYVSAWQGGSGKLTVDGEPWEDENFFISRVKPKVRFYNTGTQVYPNMTQYDLATKTGTDKRLAFWVPVSQEARSGVKLNALPDGDFDGEVFTMWPYVDVWGNWNAPFGWTPGAFADAAHKNGVAVHGVAGVPYGSINSNWKASFERLVKLSPTEIGQFLYYHGQDGLGYNSEWSGYSPSDLITMHNGLQEFMATRNPIWEVLWYGGTNDNGSIAFDTGLNNNTKLFNSASMFMNYNWRSQMSNAINTAKNLNKNPFYCYAGMNSQGGEPKDGINYSSLKNYQYSIGIWGAHSVNMYWKDRFNNGSSPETKMNTYLEIIEQWFTNAKRNPAVKMEIGDNRTHHPDDDWAGISSMMSARSTLNWELTQEPFITYFNVGNGKFFNFKGDRMNDNQWYNLGVQDHLPTWKYWFAPTFLGGQESGGIDENSVHLNAAFTWEDAYLGGSCLKISGTAEEEFMHLFKTDFTVRANFKIRVIYKIIGGKADINLVLGKKVTAPAVPEIGKTVEIVTVDGCDEVEDNSYREGKDGWTVKEITLAAGDVNSRGLANGISLVALQFENAENLEMLLGGFEILPAPTTTFATPAQPQITLSKMFVYNNSGVDAKIIWEMPNNAIVGEPVYNTDVNTSLFRLWAQQENEEPVMMGMTSSWAGLIFAAPVNPDGAKRIRFGVSALSLNMETEGEIAWTEYDNLPEYTTIDDIQISKNIIKPNESFELSYVDPLHEEGTWSITDGGDQVYWTATGKSVTCPGLETVGAYTLKLSSGESEREFPRYVAVSPDDVGALPEIYTLSIDEGDVTESQDEVEIEIGDSKNFSYTGRSADGLASRGINLNESWFGVSCAEVGLGANQSFSIAAWVKYDELPSGYSSFITVENRTGGGWPMDNWGYFWSRINEDGKFLADIIDSAWGFRTDGNADGMRIFYRYDDAKIDLGAWTHVAIVFEYENPGVSNRMRCHFYINGKKQLVSCYLNINKGTLEGLVGSETGNWTQLEKGKNAAVVYGENTYEPQYAAHNYPVNDDFWIAIGGSSQNISATMGCVDDFQIWGKAMTDEDVQKSMLGLDANDLPADVLGFWDLETAQNGQNYFVGVAGANAKSGKNAPKASLFTYNDGSRVNETPTFMAGSPFLSGTAYPIETKPTWTTRRANVDGTGTGEAGAADISWTKPGDYTVELKLENGHGSDVKSYPVVMVSEPTGIETAGADDFATYTVEDALILDFGAAGSYMVDVYNTSGMLVAQKAVEAVAGQHAQIRLNNAGVYLVKVCRDGSVLRTVKVIRK